MFENYPNVAELGDGEVVLVGEEHGNEVFSELLDNVAEHYNPTAYAVEHGQILSARTEPGSDAMEQAQFRSFRHDLPIDGIDAVRNAPREVARERNLPRGEILFVANTFTDPISPTGRVPQSCIDNARQAIYELYGQEMFDAMYTRREEAMARALHGMVEQHGGPVIAAVGAFHVPAIAELYEDHYG